MSEAVQHAAAVALTAEREFPREISEVYARRRDVLAKGLREVGLEVNVPRATPYFWVAVPAGHTSTSFTELMLEQAAVLVSPGDSYGPSGAGYVRLSLTVPDSRLEEAVDRMTRALVIIQS
jgi:LL-diaminopimelate aminotransferase